MISVKVYLSGNCLLKPVGRIDNPKPSGVKWRNVRGVFAAIDFFF